MIRMRDLMNPRTTTSTRVDDQSSDSSGPVTSRARRYLKERSIRTILLGLVFTIVILSPPADYVTDQNLMLHMFQHIGLFFGGGVVGYGLDRFLITRLLVLKRKFYPGWKILTWTMRFNARTKATIFVVAIPIIVFTYWHVPSNFDIAATNESIHLIEHATYLISGGLVGMSVNIIPRKWKAVLLFFAFMHAGMMGSIWIVWPDFFPLYTYAENLEMDTALMLFGAVGVMATGSWMLKVLDII